MDISPCRTPEVPPRTGRRANNKPTAQSCKRALGKFNTLPFSQGLPSHNIKHTCKSWSLMSQKNQNATIR